MVADLAPGAFQSLPRNLTVVGSELFFDANFNGIGRELNHGRHLDSFTATEDLAWVCLGCGIAARAVELAEGWVRAHPEHEACRLMRDEIVRWAKTAMQKA